MKLILIRLFHCFFIRFKIQYIVSKDHIMYVNWRLVRVVTGKIQLSSGGRMRIKKIFTLIIWFAFLDRNIATLVLIHQPFQLTILWQQLGLLLFQLVYIFGSLLKYRSLKYKNNSFFFFLSYPYFICYVETILYIPLNLSLNYFVKFVLTSYFQTDSSTDLINYSNNT